MLYCHPSVTFLDKNPPFFLFVAAIPRRFVCTLLHLALSPPFLFNHPVIFHLITPALSCNSRVPTRHKRFTFHPHRCLRLIFTPPAITAFGLLQYNFRKSNKSFYILRRRKSTRIIALEILSRFLGFSRTSSIGFTHCIQSRRFQSRQDAVVHDTNVIPIFSFSSIVILLLHPSANILRFSPHPLLSPRTFKII